MPKKQIFEVSAKAGISSETVMKTVVSRTRLCCQKQKIVKILVNSPEGQLLFHVCEKHRNLDYFKKYQISEEKIHEDV